MKDENIALFKRFLKTEGCNTLYAGMYNQSHPKDAPDDVEMFLREVDAKDAILGAFVFPEGNSNFGVNYWFEKAVKWEKTLESATASQFYAYCYHNKESVSREAARPLNKVNTYLHTYSTEATGMERALQTQSKETKKQSEPVKLDAWSSNKKTEEPVKQPEIPLQHSVTEEQMALSGFTMMKIGKLSRTTLSEEEITINKTSGNRVTFNRFVSDDIREAGHKFIHIFSKEKAVYFLFDNTSKDAIEWRVNGSNVVFSNKYIVDNILQFFGLKGNQTMNISKNMSKTSNNLFYKITKSK